MSIKTRTRQLPPHGTTSRARGSQGTGRPPCTCPPCRKADRAYSKHRRYLAATGRSLLVDVTPAREHLKQLACSGDALTILAERIGRPRASLAAITNGSRKRITRALSNEILALRPGTASAGNRSVPAIGSIRRFRALIALGHPSHLIAETAGIVRSTGSNLINGRPETIHHDLAQRVDKAYRELSGTPGSLTRSLRRAERERFAPPAAWDDDTIDDPNAFPDWTGYCGTDRGWWTHRLSAIAACPACDTAHAEWKTAHRHLPHRDFMVAMGRSRAAASGRGAAIAHDARELLAQGCDYDTAAERIGITRQHLQQELWRQRDKAAA
ncbi:hypothetical protein [Streptomyces sp. NBC_01716]|uniref:hypothetical protein n=1 Tax=Streptomyces sp. NBC_01716 TaxID=2975917 RepID=UPI002E378350|nr:hypothetical protein [Streptomyces sp. NBC_01716]